MSGSRRGTKDVVDILLRNSGHPRSKPMELPLLGHRARSCRSRPRAPPLRAHHCSPGLIHAARPRRRRPAPPSHRRRRPLSASLPPRSARWPAARVRDRWPLPSASPARGTRHMPCLPGSVARPIDAKRGAEPFPCSHAPQRRSPVARPSPGFIRRHRRTRRVRRLDSHRALQGRSRPRTTFEPPDALSRIARFDAAHPRRHAPRTGRLSRHYSSSSTATLPHAGALRHEPIMRRTAPEHRATHGVAAPVTNFRLREISDRGRPRTRPSAPATAPRRRRRSAVGTPSPSRQPRASPTPAAPAFRIPQAAVLRALNKLSGLHRAPNPTRFNDSQRRPTRPATEVAFRRSRPDTLRPANPIRGPTPPGTDPAPRAKSTSSPARRPARHRAPPLPPAPSR